MLAPASDNAWTKPNSGDWHEQAYWSLGILPNATQSVLFTNAGWKALAIGANTGQNFSQSMRVQSLRVEGPVDSYNTLLLNWSGFEKPLHTRYQLYTAETVAGPFQLADSQSGWSATFSDPQRFFVRPAP